MLLNLVEWFITIGFMISGGESCWEFTLLIKSEYFSSCQFALPIYKAWGGMGS